MVSIFTTIFHCMYFHLCKTSPASIFLSLVSTYCKTLHPPHSLTFPLGQQSRCDDVEGLCPWPPASLPDAERRVWMEGLRWETRHFHDQLLAPFADWMSHKTKVQRAEALFRVLQVRKTA